MSGLFRRLAGRALGQPGATQLHALARLPYQTAPGVMVEPPAPLPAESQTTAHSPLSQRQAAEQHGLEQQTAQPQASPPTSAQVAPDRTSPRAPTATKTGTRLQVKAVTEQAAFMLEGLEPVAESPSPLPPIEPRRVVTDRNAAAQTAQSLITASQAGPLIRPFVEQAHTRPRAMPAAPRRTAAASTSLPGISEQPAASPSLPEAMLPPPPFSPPSFLPPTTAPFERQREPDEVHVHIGRIEITAVQPPAPAKRTKRKGQAPLSLDDYLARRKGDGI